MKNICANFVFTAQKKIEMRNKLSQKKTGLYGEKYRQKILFSFVA